MRSKDESSRKMRVHKVLGGTGAHWHLTSKRLDRVQSGGVERQRMT